MEAPTPGGGWSVDPSLLAAMRLGHARKALDAEQPETAVAEAEELLDLEPDNLDALRVVAEAELELGAASVARLAFERCLELDDSDAHAWSGLAIAAFECADLEAATVAARRAVARDDQLAEAWYYMGLALERSERHQDAQEALLRAGQLEPDRFPTPVRLDDDAWAAAIHTAVERLPIPLKDWLDDVPLHGCELPAGQRFGPGLEPISPVAAALYVGEPPDELQDPWTVKPPAFELFRANVERHLAHGAPSPERVLMEALRAEILDWLGLPEGSHPLTP